MINIENLLLVEDSEFDIDISIKYLKCSSMIDAISTVNDGLEALEFLNKSGKFKDVTTPSLILLDLNIPKMSGKEVLRRIKSNQKLLHIPVIILTSSKYDREILESEGLIFDHYIVKPIDLTKFDEIVLQIEDFWREAYSESIYIGR